MKDHKLKLKILFERELNIKIVDLKKQVEYLKQEKIDLDRRCQLKKSECKEIEISIESTKQSIN